MRFVTWHPAQNLARSPQNMDMDIVRKVFLGNDLCAPWQFLSEAFGEEPQWRDLKQKNKQHTQEAQRSTAKCA